MARLKLLDVTLRDGGYTNDFQFKQEHLSNILSTLDASGIDVVEVGYRKGCLNPPKSIGATGQCTSTYLKFCKQYLHQTDMAVMAHCHNIRRADIIELKQCGASLLRLCVSKDNHANAFSLMQYAKEAELSISINFKNVSHYSENALTHSIQDVMPYEPDMIYFADSNGSLHPKQVTALFSSNSQQFKIPFGFHAHDNLGLAQANCLAAIEAGAEYIDGSLAGLGKGLGNLKLEYFAAYLKSIGDQRYDLEPLISGCNYVQKTFKNNRELSEIDFIRGIKDLSAHQLDEYRLVVES